MKNSIYIIGYILLCFGCNKDEASVNNTIIGEWNVTAYYFEHLDSECKVIKTGGSYQGDDRILIYDNSEMILDYGGTKVKKGTYYISDDEIYFTETSNAKEKVFKIIRVSDNDLVIGEKTTDFCQKDNSSIATINEIHLSQ